MARLTLSHTVKESFISFSRLWVWRAIRSKIYSKHRDFQEISPAFFKNHFYCCCYITIKKWFISTTKYFNNSDLLLYIVSGWSVWVLGCCVKKYSSVSFTARKCVEWLLFCMLLKMIWLNLIAWSNFNSQIITLCMWRIIKHILLFQVLLFCMQQKHFLRLLLDAFISL